MIAYFTVVNKYYYKTRFSTQKISSNGKLFISDLDKLNNGVLEFSMYIKLFIDLCDC